MSVHGTLNFGEGVYEVVSCGFDGGLRNHAILSGTRGVMTLPRAYGNSRHPTTPVIEVDDGQEVRGFDPVDEFQLEAEDLARAIRTGSAPLLPPDDGLRNARAMDALIASAKSGGGPVPLEQSGRNR